MRAMVGFDMASLLVLSNESSRLKLVGHCAAINERRDRRISLVEHGEILSAVQSVP